MFYDDIKAVCKRKGTSVSAVLKGINRSTGVTGQWKKGSYPSLDVAMEMAEYMGITLDELVYNREPTPSVPSGSTIDPEWVDIISRIPEDKQQLCKDFLRTHMVVPEKFADQDAG